MRLRYEKNDLAIWTGAAASLHKSRGDFLCVNICSAHDYAIIQYGIGCYAARFDGMSTSDFLRFFISWLMHPILGNTHQTRSIFNVAASAERRRDFSCSGACAEPTILACSLNGLQTISAQRVGC